MTQGSLPDNYVGREQAFVKHSILKTYIERLFMIVCMNKANIVNFVDCFSGPWQEGDEELSDTSIGISLKQMDRCRGVLKHKFKREVKFRALYIEKDPEAFAKLEQFLANSPYKDIETACINADYSEVTDEIVNWCGGHFSFLFLDPKGWDIGLSKVAPLLEMPDCEFLINLMYDSINRFVTVDVQEEKMIDIFGEIPDFEFDDARSRHITLVDLCRDNLNTAFGGRTAYVNVEQPGKDRVLYNLIYLTRHARGLEVFKTEAEKLDIVQRVTQMETKLRQQQAVNGMGDLFGHGREVAELTIEDNRNQAKNHIIDILSAGPTKIDLEMWADWLEKTDLYPRDFQLAMKELVKEKVVINQNANVGRRTKNIIVPDYLNKCETWALAT